MVSSSGPESGLFANAEHVRRRILDEVDRQEAQAVVLDGETMPYIDITAVAMLRELDETLERKGVRLVFARDVGTVRDIVRRAGAGAPETPLYPTVQAAVDALRERHNSAGA